ncbi:uncharacterized protein LOC113555647 [Rhopalosiphum maidis]|uniref:uncharacterized protein LOC113555647 n=1 Tax=Rhopalosiphum maidis TaxID=43146 RepID=UPI000F001266|nr:uncharacterized protein LOC113555647 [Rhopalosiphum maidis]
MLIQCSLIIQNLVPQAEKNNSQSLRSYLLTKKVNGKYYVRVSNSTYPNGIHYDIAMLEHIYYKFIKERKMGLEFKEPRQMLLIIADDKEMLHSFYHQLIDIINGKNVIIGTRHLLNMANSNNYNNNIGCNTKPVDFVDIDRFNNSLLNMKHLGKLVLENCDLPTIPVQIGNLPIKYLSISGSKLPTSQFNQDTFWNWMSMDTICGTLSTLKMDSIGLKSLPFEILFLKNLQTLSAAKNMLTYLPHFIAEMKKLDCLFFGDNLLSYYPDSICCKIFQKVDISNNPFQLPEYHVFEHLVKYVDVFTSLKRPDDDLIVKPLSHLSFYSLINNCVPFKRQDIPRTLWLYFDVVGRCMLCKRLLLPDYCEIRHRFGLPTAISLTKDQRTTRISRQYLLCRISDKFCVKR